MRGILFSVLLFSFQGAGVVTGRVSKTDGSPVVGVRVAAIESSSRNSEALMSIAQTDSEGRYRLENVPPGSYYIAAGPLDSLHYFPGSSDLSRATAVAVGVGATVGPLNFTYNPWSNIIRTVQRSAPDQAGRFFGHVLKTTGDPFQNVTISLSHIESQARFITCTDGSGAFEFSGLPTGQFAMEVLAPIPNGYRQAGYESFTASITLSPNVGLEQDLRLRMIVSELEARIRPERQPLRSPDAPVRAGSGTGIVRGALQDATVPKPRIGRGGRVEDSVGLQAIIGVDGNVLSLRAMSPDSDSNYTRAALQAAIHWKFLPPTLARSSEPVEQFGVITVYFDP
jgi:5-hydroxyisourate hydrolase-like protein (transthyretin family)